MAGTPIKNLFPAGICGATNRRGLPCAIRLAVFKCKNGKYRCKYHGGLSTGAKTPEGKARAIQAMRDGLKRWQEQRRERAGAPLELNVKSTQVRPPVVGVPSTMEQER